MDRATIICTDNDNIIEADILHKSDRYMKVAFVGDVTLELYKDTPNARVYIGYMFGMEFTSEGV